MDLDDELWVGSTVGGQCPGMVQGIGGTNRHGMGMGCLMGGLE